MVPMPIAATAASFAVVLGLQACSPDAGGLQGSLPSGRPAPAAADFVAASRPEKLDYIPVTTPAAEPSPPARSAAEIAAAEAEMEALRARNEARGAAVRRAAGAVKPVP